jgi:dipeptidyl aminopeptidase/acylaminoacyl peptidase
MFNKATTLAALAAVLLATRAVAQDRALPPVEAFGSLPAISQVQLSPDGQHIAALQAFDGRPVAIIYSIGNGEKPVVVSSKDWIVQGLQWAKNDRLLLFLGKNEKVGWDSKRLMRSWGRTLSVSPDGESQVVLFGDNLSLNNNTITTDVADLDLDDPNTIFMPLSTYDQVAVDDAERDRSYDEDANYFRENIYSVDVRTGHSTRVENGTLDTVEWYLDGHGKIIGRLDQTQKPPLTDSLELYDNGSWSKVASFDASDDKGAGIFGLSDDGKSLIQGVVPDTGTTKLTSYDIATGKTAVLFSNPSYDVDHVVSDPWTGRVIGAAYFSDNVQYFYFDPSREALQRGLEAAFPGRSVSAVSFDLARDKVIALVESPQEPPAYYFVDRTTHQASLFGESYPKLLKSDLGEMKPYDFTARDGLHIPGYITLPPGRATKNLPAIVLPHGGPDARDAIGFDWLAQFLASRGYVVLQPNFRGSWGYGRAFTQAGLHQWGLKMQDDITDGVKKMIADGIADPKRVCIVGWSYGGYAALAGAAFTPDLYACTASIAGISDLPAMLRAERTLGGRRGKLVSFWSSRIGSIYDDSDAIRAVSPARHADQVKCPILLLHGENDSTVPIEQSETMNDALKSAGKSVEFVKLEGDDHYAELSTTRVKILTELETFLKANIGN